MLAGQASCYCLAQQGLSFYLQYALEEQHWGSGACIGSAFNESYCHYALQGSINSCSICHAGSCAAQEFELYCRDPKCSCSCLVCWLMLL